MSHLFRALALAAVVVVSACSPAPSNTASAGGIVVTDAWSMATPPGAAVGAGYMTISNQGAAAVHLTGGETAAAERVEIHNMSMDGGVMTMRPVEGGLEVPASGSVVLKPSGLHLMLVGLKAPLTEGGSVPLTLVFDNGTRVETTLTVHAMGGGHEH